MGQGPQGLGEATRSLKEWWTLAGKGIDNNDVPRFRFVIPLCKKHMNPTIGRCLS